MSSPPARWPNETLRRALEQALRDGSAELQCDDVETAKRLRWKLYSMRRGSQVDLALSIVGTTVKIERPTMREITLKPQEPT